MSTSLLIDKRHGNASSLQAGIGLYPAKSIFFYLHGLKEILTHFTCKFITRTISDSNIGYKSWRDGVDIKKLKVLYQLHMNH